MSTPPYIHRILITALCLLGWHWCFAQQPTGNWRDSLNIKVRLLTELTQAANFEEAQVEANNLRFFLHKKFIYCPPKVVSLISGVYFTNKDKVSAAAFLAECEQDAQRDRNPETKALLLSAVVTEHYRWAQPERAVAAQALLNAAQDTISARRLTAQTNVLKHRVDSLRRELETTKAIKSNTVTLERNRALVLGGVLLLVLFSLLLANIRTANSWRKRLENRELEWDLQRGNMLHEAQEMPQLTNTQQTEAVIPAAPQGTTAYQSQRPHQPVFGDYTPQIALVIEPNRQIALYVRSLLNNQFEVEMASTATEGLEMANQLLPDLIVCDTALDGQGGIDITRQIKLGERTNHIPVVLLSGHFGNDGRLDALRAGADAWFTRPMLDLEFNTSVRQLIDNQKARHEDFARFLQLYYTGSRIPQPDKFLTQIITQIEAHIAEPDFMPDDIARRMQLTNQHFVKKLRVLTGKEPIQLIRELRLEKARFLLEKQAGTPQAIAQLVGFSNPGTFALAFKEYFGENTMLLHGRNLLH